MFVNTISVRTTGPLRATRAVTWSAFTECTYSDQFERSELDAEFPVAMGRKRKADPCAGQVCRWFRRVSAEVDSCGVIGMVDLSRTILEKLHVHLGSWNRFELGRLGAAASGESKQRQRLMHSPGEDACQPAAFDVVVFGQMAMDLVVRELMNEERNPLF